MFNGSQAGRITFQEHFDYHPICKGWQRKIAIFCYVSELGFIHKIKYL